MYVFLSFACVLVNVLVSKLEDLICNDIFVESQKHCVLKVILFTM